MADKEKPPVETKGAGAPDPNYQPPADRQMPPVEQPVSLEHIDDAIKKMQEKIASTGLSTTEEKVTRFCVAAFGDTQFTVAMLCAQVSIDAQEALECCELLHAIGILRCPHNDGGQALYQVMPGVVHPRGLGAAAF